MKIKIIGIGGIGCSLLKTLPQFLAYYHDEDSDEEPEVTLIDGDDFEPRNRDRQADLEVGNKAEEMAKVLTEQWGELIFDAVPSYVSSENVISVVREGDIVFLCVDNHATRRLVSDRCQELQDVLIISGGNEFTDGNIQVNWRRGGEELTMPIANEFHPEILFPRDKNPAERGCDEIVESAPQLLLTNNAVATLMLNAFYAFLEGRLDYDEVYIDMFPNNTRSVKRERVA